MSFSLQYPANIDHGDYDYDPSFSVRGLHCDVKKVKSNILLIYILFSDVGLTFSNFLCKKNGDSYS